MLVDIDLLVSRLALIDRATGSHLSAAFSVQSVTPLPSPLFQALSMMQAETHAYSYRSQNLTDYVYKGERCPSATSCSLICFTVRTARSQIFFACAGVQIAGGASIRQSPPPSILNAGIPRVEIPFSRERACMRCARRGAKVSWPGHATSIAQKTPAPLMSTTNPPRPPFSSSSERLKVNCEA